MPPVKKSTRGEALRAYNESKKRLQEEKETDVKTTLIVEEEKRTVAAALAQHEDDIVKSITEIKLQIAKDLDSISERRLAEFKKLSEIEKAVAIESKRLEDLYNITYSADTLMALVQTQDELRAAFNSEMEEKKNVFNDDITTSRKKWEKEKEIIEEEIIERKLKVERERKQEEEEYVYKMTKKRQIETDTYELKKANLEKEIAQKKEIFEKEFTARESAIKNQEQDLADLRKKVADFPSQLDKAIKDTENKIREKIEIQYKHQSEMLIKEIEGERKLHSQAVESLITKITEKDALIGLLTKKADETGRQVQDIAVKAIDGASKLRVIRDYPEKDKNVSDK